ncbi:hypothetical protein [Actinoallomurus sp. NPDC052274]|uniref:hypothetical protein n=1 Tax=Actinoallomurus sp. NPDC052274 TaxID=3155420 RepID=UPI00342C55AB
MTATAAEEQERRAHDMFGLRPSGAVVCPRVVAGKRCIAHNGTELCVCQRHYRLLDHARIWLDETGRHVLTGEPYSAAGEDLADLITDMSELGLDVNLSGRSPWNPGFTLLIRITKREAT